MANRVFLVTGASSGIGEATARRLATEPGVELVLVARREERLRELAAALPAPASWVAADLTDSDAPARVAAHIEERHARLDLLVNNAGASWRGSFGDEGWANVERTMELNFNAVVRLTEALLPILRRAAPRARGKIESPPRRGAPAGAGAYSASKFALVGWSDSLYSEELPHSVHVGLVLPGFIATEGFPARELKAKAITRWTVSTPDKVAEAIVDTGLRGKAERYVPRPYGLIAVLRVVAPRLVRRILAGGAAKVMTTATKE